MALIGAYPLIRQNIRKGGEDAKEVTVDSRPKTFRNNAPVGIRILGAVIVAASLGGAVFGLTSADGDPGILIPVTAMAVSAALGVAIGISHISVSVDEGQITVGLWPLYRRTLAHDEVASFKLVEDVRPVSFGGIGYRRVPGGRIGLLWSGGSGVEIDTTDGKHITVVIDEADELHESLARTT